MQRLIYLRKKYEDVVLSVDNLGVWLCTKEDLQHYALLYGKTPVESKFPSDIFTRKLSFTTDDGIEFQTIYSLSNN